MITAGTNKRCCLSRYSRTAPLTPQRNLPVYGPPLIVCAATSGFGRARPHPHVFHSQVQLGLPLLPEVAPTARSQPPQVPTWALGQALPEFSTTFLGCSLSPSVSTLDTRSPSRLNILGGRSGMKNSTFWLLRHPSSLIVFRPSSDVSAPDRFTSVPDATGCDHGPCGGGPDPGFPEVPSRRC